MEDLIKKILASESFQSLKKNVKTKTETKNNINHDTIFYTPQHSRKPDK